MEFCLPDLGEGIVQAELVQWLVAPGDTVARGQNIAEVMTDKAAVELPSPFTGTIDQLLISPGSYVDVGSVMATFEPAESNQDRSPTIPRSNETASGSPPGAATSQEPVDPATADAPASAPAIALASKSRPVAAPSVRRKARQLGIDLSKVQGTGPNNRILTKDLDLSQPRMSDRMSDRTGLPTPSTPTVNGNRPHPSPTPSMRNDPPVPGTRIPLQGLRRTIAQRMTHATQSIPHFSYVDEVDLTDLVKIRESLKSKFADDGIKLTYLPFIIKAAIGALKEVPQVNASIDADANEIVLHDRYHIGIATDTPSGLMVPVIHDADQKGLPQIAAELGHLTAAARNGESKLEQLTGSTFTVTSTGGIGGLISTPIINEPGVGILGIGQIVKRPRFDASGNIYAADIAYLSFSFDHRVVDGADAARFSNALIARLNRPAGLLLDE